jgi:hypothetical protein
LGRLASEEPVKVHFWTGDFTVDRVRKLACGKPVTTPLRNSRNHPQLREVDDIDEFKLIPIKDLCIGCRKRLFARLNRKV